ncbi:MAG TPA: DNA polymerase/3'-5' exonuclease PolX [Armatimonadota bacterium]|jgi:DNA polymerase (family 10)
MTNDQLAEALEEIGDRLEVQGEAFYKVQAYRRAAQTLQDTPTSAQALHRQGELSSLPHVGKAISAKLGELLDTGRMEYLEKLRQEVPDSVRELLRVPGLGPKKVGSLVKEAGVRSLDDLEQAASSGRLATLPGMGDKTIQNLLEGVAVARRQLARIPFHLAQAQLEEIVGRLAACPQALKPVAVGSYRRGSTTMGDLDVVAASASPEPVVSCFVGMPGVKEVLGQGDTKASVRLLSGVQVDLRVVPPEAYGSLLHHFTGSKEHNLQLRGFAKARGLSINEYGILNEATGERRAFESEAELFEHLGLAFIAPEIREGNGEIEAAKEGRLPHLVAVGDVRGDLHLHTNASDGRNTLREMALAARDLGYEYLAICDHSMSRGHAGGLSIDRLRAQMGEIDALNREELGITLLKGTESDILSDGSLDYPEGMLAELDLVVASIHSGMRQPKDQMTERLLRAVRNPYCTILGHPTGRLLGTREGCDIDLDALLEEAAKTGTLLEINSMPDRLDLEGPLVRRAKAAGARFTIDTDAHRCEHLGHMMPYGVTQARRGWLEPADVVNCLPLEELREALSAKQRRASGRS